jgi:tetratricopeptide (TPR) repeat protein
MASVFISYRQTDDGQRERVCAFGVRLRDCGIEVVLDQFFLEVNPGGPNDGWAKWSSDRAWHAEFVLIVGTDDWFQCFEKRQKPGTGLGSACEADDLRQRIYDAGGLNDNIRVLVFDDGDAANIPGKLKGYHRFHAERDFASVVRWLGGTVPRQADATGSTPRTSIPHNLPALQPFFGREEELRKIADALDPESRTWGALIDGPGGIGKTSLAVRAAYDASPGAFKKIVFVSLKSRELDDDGVRDLSGFLITGLAELFNELAREIGPADISKAPEDERPRLLLDTLHGTYTLLVLDNLESLTKRERDTLFTLVKRLPQGCKAILTSRGRIGSAAEELILARLGEDASLATLATLADTNSALAKTTEVERRTLYRETGGTPLLLRWTAGQIGRGRCLTFADAISYLRSCPEGNDPLGFIFGDLVDNFTTAETLILCALTYFTLPARVTEIAALAGCSESDADGALRGLTNRSLVVPSEELKTFTLVPLVADFLRAKRPEVVAQTGDRLEQRAYALLMENGHRKYECFPVLSDAWPTLAAALPRFLVRNEQLQTVCSALDTFLAFTGRWDEQVALLREAESRALAVGDHLNAGWQAYRLGLVHHRRGQASGVFACADRAAVHWHEAKAGIHERATAIRLRGLGHELTFDYAEAIANYRESAALHRNEGHTQDLAIRLNDLAIAEELSGDLEAAERDYGEALQTARDCGDRAAVALSTGNLAELAQTRGEWELAETLLREALPLAEEVGRLDLIARLCHYLAKAFLFQDKRTEAIPYVRRAVHIYSRLRVPAGLNAARTTLALCMADADVSDLMRISASRRVSRGRRQGQS